jgi:uridylate kinase
MCRENDMPIVVFDINITGNLMKVVNGIRTGTLISD